MDTADVTKEARKTLRRGNRKVGTQAAKLGAQAGSTASEIGAKVGQSAAKLGAQAGATAGELGAKTGVRSGGLGVKVGRRSAKAGTKAGARAAKLGARAGVAGAVFGARQSAKGTRTRGRLALRGAKSRVVHAPADRLGSKMLDTTHELESLTGQLKEVTSALNTALDSVPRRPGRARTYAGLTLGAFAMYLLDPAHGPERRKQVAGMLGGRS